MLTMPVMATVLVCAVIHISNGQDVGGPRNIKELQMHRAAKHRSTKPI